MEKKFNQFINFVSKNTQLTRDVISFNSSSTKSGSMSEPQLGFKVSYCDVLRQLTVKVIGARMLPSDYGSVKAKGYVIKVTVFPQKEKFETRVVKDSWPTINEEFIFPLSQQNPKKYGNEDCFKDKFVSFTVYSVLDETSTNEEHLVSKPKTMLKRLLSFGENEDFLRRNSSIRQQQTVRRSLRYSLSNRRTIGAVTYNLDRKIFTQKLRNNIVSTPDVWRNVKEITSGIQTQPREGKKGCVELTLQYAVSEDGKNDVVEVSVTKFRCSLQTMQDHEKLGGQLYIKITAFESDDVLQKKKSDRFEPTISLKLESNTATLRATVNNYNLNQVKIVVRLLCKNMLGKKTLLGKIEIDRYSQFWKEIVATPLVAVTKMINFE